MFTILVGLTLARYTYNAYMATIIPSSFQTWFFKVHFCSFCSWGLVTTSLKGGPTTMFYSWNNISDFWPRWIPIYFELKFYWKKLFALIVTKIVQRRNFGNLSKPLLKPLWTYYDQYYRKKQLYKGILKAIV
jgi:hypothetical protein